MSKQELMPVTTTTERMAELINIHLGELLAPNPAWLVTDSPISGRGIFAARDIQPGEEIFRDRPLLVGPIAHKARNLNICVICYTLLEGSIDDVLCKAGCALPVCENCSQTSERHRNECKLFRKWQPKDLKQISTPLLRILSVVRCFFLDESQRKLLYAMQANADKYYVKEVERAAACFEHFPKEPEMLEYFHRTICAFNTNAFEGRSSVNGNIVQVRALFPLAGLLNHQCTPNASHHFLDTETIVISATSFIPQGAEIVTSYTKVLWSNLSRKLFLAMTKHFICQCSRCQDPSVSECPTLSTCS